MPLCCPTVCCDPSHLICRVVCLRILIDIYSQAVRLAIDTACRHASLTPIPVGEKTPRSQEPQDMSCVVLLFPCPQSVNGHQHSEVPDPVPGTPKICWRS